MELRRERLKLETRKCFQHGFFRIICTEKGLVDSSLSMFDNLNNLREFGWMR